jgi:polysaccharide biosynthesis/export protein
MMRIPLKAMLCVAGLASVVMAADVAYSDASQLPAGMSVEQAKALAKEQGITSREQAASASGRARPTTFLADTLGRINPEEGESVLANRNDTAENKSLGKIPLPLSDTLRFAQAIFQRGNPSLFASYVGAVGANYQLGAGDQVLLTLWGQKEARYELTLDRSGQVSIEGVGMVSLNGLSLRDAQTLLQKRLTRIYAGMSNGQVSMDLTMGKLRQIRVFMTGDVENPGSYMLSGNTNVFNALYQAKGPSNLGSERKIEIIRGTVHHEVDLYDYLFRGRRTSVDALQDGDIVRVPVHGPVVQVRGDVGRPGRYEMLASESAKELFSYCGGVTSTTAGQNVVVSRIFDNGRREAVLLPSALDLAKGKATAKFQDGDELLVYKGSDPSRQTVFMVGEVRFPGAYPLQPGMTVADLVKQAGGYSEKVYEGAAQVMRRRPDSSFAAIKIGVLPVATLALQAGDSVRFYNRYEMVSRGIVVLSGAVRKPGAYILDSGMTAKDLVLRGGGFLKDADFRHARVEFPLDTSHGARVEILVIDSSLASGGADLVLADGAHLAIPFLPILKVLEIITVQGMVNHPGSYALLSPQERISSILKRAGNIRPEGYASGARLIRKGLGRVSINVESALREPGSYNDLELRAGDTLLVPQTPATVKVSGRVYNPGNIPWKPKRDWKWYVSQAAGMTDSSDAGKVYLRLADGSVQTVEYGIDSLPDPGSEIVVPFAKPPEALKYSDIISAVGATVSIVLTALTIYMLVSKN